MVLGLVASVVLAQGSLLHAIGMVVLGLLLGLIGTDVNSGTQRFTFGIYELADGIGFVTVAMGMFGLGEIIRNLENEEERSVMVKKITGLWPLAKTSNVWSRRSFAVLSSARPWAFFLAAARSWVPSPPTPSKRRSRKIAQFGKGAIEGVAAGSRPTTPARKPPLFPCSPWGFHQIRSAR